MARRRGSGEARLFAFLVATAGAPLAFPRAPSAAVAASGLYWIEGERRRARAHTRRLHHQRTAAV
jgi:hypothetical protein